MPELRQFKFAALLAALPLLAAASFLQQKYLTQAVPLQASSLQKVSPGPSLPSKPIESSFTFLPSMYSAAQKAILKQARTKMKTMPTTIQATGASLLAVNTVYSLASGFDVNGFEYFQNKDKTQYCQWSTISLCWCLRGSLISDSVNAMPSASYNSNAKQSYRTGPAGTYGLGGMGFTRGKITCPIVRSTGTSSHRNTPH